MASAGAAQQQPKPVPHKVPAQHKPVTSTASAAHHPHGAVQPARKTAKTEKRVSAKPKSAMQTPAHPVVSKKPTGAPKAAAPAGLPGVPSAAALADQTPVLSETGHGRDPFAALIRATDPNAGHENLPPGIAGLQVATLRIQGMVRTADGMVAVVANPQESVYFLHDGDHIFDGVVEKIGIDDITFRQQSKDAFGRTIDRNVSKRLYPIAGDEQ